MELVLAVLFFISMVYNGYLMDKYNDTKQQLSMFREVVDSLMLELASLGSPNVKVIDVE